MAKSDPNSNGLRQDQPEWCPSGLIPGPKGVLAGVDMNRHTIALVCVVSGVSSGLDDTERPRLTSDRRLRRSAGSAILIPCGPNCIVRRVKNPSNFGRSDERGSGDRPALVFVLRISGNGRRVFNLVELTALRHAVSWRGLNGGARRVYWGPKANVEITRSIYSSSRYSIPCFETLAFVMESRSLSQNSSSASSTAGAVSSHAQPSYL